MKGTTRLLGLLTFGFALLLLPFTPTVQAQSQSQQPSNQQEPRRQQGQIYTGQIVKAKNGQYGLLVDRQSGTGFYLDDQEKARQFEGQLVKVIGTLDAGSNTIHVTEIQPA